MDGMWLTHGRIVLDEGSVAEFWVLLLFLVIRIVHLRFFLFIHLVAAKDGLELEVVVLHRGALGRQVRKRVLLPKHERVIGPHLHPVLELLSMRAVPASLVLILIV